MRHKIEKTLRIRNKIREREMKEEDSSDDETNKRKEIKDDFFVEEGDTGNQKGEKVLYLHNFKREKRDGFSGKPRQGRENRESRFPKQEDPKPTVVRKHVKL